MVKVMEKEGFSVEYLRGFNDAMELILNRYNKLGLRKELQENCKNCKIIEEAAKIQEAIIEKYHEKLKENLCLILDK